MKKFDRKKLYRYITSYMRNHYQMILDKSDDNDFREVFITNMKNENYKEAFNYCCTYNCLWFELEMCENLVLLFNRKVLKKIALYNINDTVLIDIDSSIWDALNSEYQATLSFVECYIFN
jgi:hypothetical protein